jgi:NitT/TauT family transport system substrate-binding protein
MAVVPTRRRFLGAAALAGAAGMVRMPRAFGADERLETTTIRLPIAPAICTMPQMITRQLLQAEGFTNIRFVDEPEPPANAAYQLACGEVDLTGCGKMVVPSHFVGL